jgi:hypothetical protein
LTKYLKIGVSGPYVNTSQTTFVKLDDDDIGDDGKCKQKYADEMVGDAIANYIDSWSETVDEADVPEEDRW